MPVPANYAPHSAALSCLDSTTFYGLFTSPCQEEGFRTAISRRLGFSDLNIAECLPHLCPELFKPSPHEYLEQQIAARFQVLPTKIQRQLSQIHDPRLIRHPDSGHIWGHIR